MNAAPLHLLTGGRGVGKTTFCQHLVELARHASWSISGLLSPAILTGALKTGIAAVHIASGHQRPLACLATSLPPSASSPTLFDLPLGPWLFSSQTLQWCNDLLPACLPCDLLIIDELGPLELLRSQGWQAALPLLHQSTYRLALVVVRPELISTASALLPTHQVHTLPPGTDPQAAAAQWWQNVTDG